MNGVVIGVLTAKAVFFPLDRQLELDCGSWSRALAQLAVWLASQVSYGASAEILDRVGQMPMSSSSVWRQMESWGNKLVQEEKEASQQANAMPSRDEPQRGQAHHERRMGVSMDGWMIYIRGEEWKEVKSGSVFEVESVTVTDRQTGEPMERAAAVACTYVAHLGGPDEFGSKLWAEAQQRHVPGAKATVCVCDAAAWIWERCQDYFPDAEQVVDWYHALTHLHTAAQLGCGQDTPAAQRWLEQSQHLLFHGHADRIAQQIDAFARTATGETADRLRTEATFFRNQQRRMRYLQYREDGWPIGSGVMESGCKQLQARFKGAGMRWSRSGADRLLAFRAVFLSGRFDTTWAHLLNSPAA